nr:lipoprotein signal peptidase [Psychrobacter sp.]
MCIIYIYAVSYSKVFLKMEDHPIILILNLLALVALLYFVLAIPLQALRRFKRKKKGQVVSPISLITKKILKYWMITAAILIPTSVFITYTYLTSLGVSNGDIATAIVLQSILGNIFTSLFIGYFFMVLWKDRWSYSADPENIKN